MGRNVAGAHQQGECKRTLVGGNGRELLNLLARLKARAENALPRRSSS
jgi:hypothetical protein